jgi:hypothetical protein
MDLLVASDVLLRDELACQPGEAVLFDLDFIIAGGTLNVIATCACGRGTAGLVVKLHFNTQISGKFYFAFCCAVPVPQDTFTVWDTIMGCLTSTALQTNTLLKNLQKIIRFIGLTGEMSCLLRQDLP